MNCDLVELRDWLLKVGCIHVAMESAGSYWKPVFILWYSKRPKITTNSFPGFWSW